MNKNRGSKSVEVERLQFMSGHDAMQLDEHGLSGLVLLRLHSLMLFGSSERSYPHRGPGSWSGGALCSG